MPSIVSRWDVDESTLADLRRARTDLVLETPHPTEPDTWIRSEGPFNEYRRSLSITPASAGRPGVVQVTETTDFKLATLVWSPLVGLLMKRGLKSLDRKPRGRLWWPAEVVPQRAAQMVSALVIVSIMAGYLGVLIGQTVTFAAKDFGVDDSTQANVLAAVRVGVLLSLFFLARADRIGRRPLVLGLTTGAILFTALGSLSPNIWALGATQLVARGLTTGLITLVVLAATEEVPYTSRAFSISLVTISAGLGAGMVLWVLPIVDFVEGGWRIMYLVPLIFLPFLTIVHRHLPETRRFDAAAAHHSSDQVNWRRFAMLGSTAFLAALFLSPASQLRNEFLTQEIGFSATQTSFFQLIVFAPAASAVVVAGLIADRVGRRWLATLALGFGSILVALAYQMTGPLLWILTSAGSMISGMAFPATRGYQTELFPTRSRARVGGLLDVVGVMGSAVGLVIVGQLASRWDRLSDAISVMVVAPILVAILIFVAFPETAKKELEVFNPNDPSPDPSPKPNPKPDPASGLASGPSLVIENPAAEV